MQDSGGKCSSGNNHRRNRCRSVSKRNEELLTEAIAAAQTVLDNTEATEEQQTEAIAALVKTMKECQASRIPKDCRCNCYCLDICQCIWKNTEDHSKSSQMRALYGYVKPEEFQNEVTALDAFADIHAAMYGDKLRETPEAYLEVKANGWITKVFGESGGNVRIPGK